jgi:geranylgeranylglycerol-phosphate geranylgeranyltransferase
MAAAAFAVLVGYFVANGRDAIQVLPAAVFTALATGTGNIINDYFDASIDRVNKPRRPIPSQRLSSRSAVILYFILTTLTAVGAFLFLPLPLGILVVVWQVSLYVYARWAKRVFVLGNFMVAAVASSAFIAGGLLTGDVGAEVVPVAIAFLFVLSRELVKGMEDLEGDLQAGVHTVAAVIGLDKTVCWASGLMLSLAVLIPVPALTSYYGKFYFWVMESTVVPLLLLSAYLILTNVRRCVFSRVSTMLKLGMFCGVLAVGLGKI